MRIFFIFLLIFSVSAIKAQTLLQPAFQNGLATRNSLTNSNRFDSASKKTWFITSYNSIATGYNFFNGGNAAFVAAPFTFQLNRKLTNNVYAFAGVTVAPVYASFNRAFINTDLNKINSFNSFSRPGGVYQYSAATLGLMYINNDKTFSISGSLSVERSAYPLYYNNRVNNVNQKNIHYNQ
ncbi:MAG: hypothetical protein ABI358_08330 [Ginsengibacter sp.]